MRGELPATTWAVSPCRATGTICHAVSYVQGRPQNGSWCSGPGSNVAATKLLFYAARHNLVEFRFASADATSVTSVAVRCDPSLDPDTLVPDPAMSEVVATGAGTGCVQDQADVALCLRRRVRAAPDPAVPRQGRRARRHRPRGSGGLPGWQPRPVNLQWHQLRQRGGAGGLQAGLRRRHAAAMHLHHVHHGRRHVLFVRERWVCHVQQGRVDHLLGLASVPGGGWFGGVEQCPVIDWQPPHPTSLSLTILRTAYNCFQFIDADPHWPAGDGATSNYSMGRYQ